MRVLLRIRDNYQERPGGDVVQAERTLAALRELGIDADLSAEPLPDLRPYDLIHIFNTTIIEAPLRQTIQARNWGLPIVLSTIFWDLSAYRAATWPTGRPRWEARQVAALVARERAWQAFVLQAASVLLPNAEAEADALRRAFPAAMAQAQVQVVPNGVETQFANGDGQRFCQQYGVPYRGFVLCVARKEDRKNQYRLIAACADLGYPLVLIGAEPPEFAAYVADCRALATARGAQVLFLPHDTPEALADAYAAARVHALPSLFESVGLSSLEGALGGANIVSTRESAADEYLGAAAWYCDPYDTASIRDAVAAAYAAPLSTTLGSTVAEQFSWRRVAAITADAYQQALAQHAKEREMTEQEAPIPDRPRWLPEMPLSDYAAYLEDLIQRQLAAADGTEAQLANLLQQVDQGNAGGAAQQALSAERAERQRVETAYQQLAADATALQDYCRQLEAALAKQGRPTLPGRLRRLLVRRR